MERKEINGLNPCPFCGPTKTFLQRLGEFGCCWIECDKCESHGPCTKNIYAFMGKETVYIESEKEAIELWNKRI